MTRSLLSVDIARWHAQDRQTLFFIPIVDDAPQNVGIRSFWHSIEETAWDKGAAVFLKPEALILPGHAR